jgi:hypothetical protein
MRLHHSHQEPRHSHLMVAGDPAEWVTVRHSDGSFSQVKVALVDDHLDVAVCPSTTHEPHLTGM